MNPDLRDLLRAWTADPTAELADLTESRTAELLARVRADEAFRAEFVAEIHLLGQLHAVQSPEPRWLQLEDELATEAEDDPAFEDRVLDRLAEPPRPTDRPRSRRVWLLPAAIAASLAAGLVVGLSVASRDRAPVGPAPAQQQEVATKPAKPAEAVAVVVKADGAKWDSAKPFDEGALVPAGRHKLTAGRVTLTLFNGVVMSVQGPADLDLTDPARVFCHRGKVRARTSPDADEFAVMAPGAAVVDLGTEFAVTVAEDGKVDAMVFEGKAEVSLLNADGDSVRSELLEGRKAVRVDTDAGRIREVPAVVANFAPAPELVAPSLRLDPAYRETVLKSRPWGYWRFDEAKAGGIPNEVPNRPQLRPTGTIPLVGDGNRVAEFDAPKVEKHYVMDGSWTPPRRDGYAIELWVMPRELNVGSLVALTARATEPAQKHIAMLELVGKEHHLIHEPGAVRFMERWPAAHAGGVNVFSRRMYVPYRWHHIVARRTTDRMEIYLNGELAGTSTIDPADETTPCRLMVGRMKHGKQPGPDQERPFVGRLDELAVYDHPLSPADIRRHFELGNVPGFGGK